jgi:hypothetical protein
VNPRTLELAQQAGLKKQHGSDREYMGDFDWREFAELIVQECVDVVSEIPVIDNGHPHPAWKIKQHFGIES